MYDLVIIEAVRQVFRQLFTQSAPVWMWLF